MEDYLLHVCIYVCAKCCYPQKIKSLLTYLLKCKIKLRAIGYNTVPHQMYQPSLPKVHKQTILPFLFFNATFTWSLLML